MRRLVEHPDLRSASEHLANIRQVLNPAIADLAAVLGVSRQAIYKWIGGESMPDADNFKRIQSLSHVADAFHEAGITRAPAMLKMKAFEGRSLMDLITSDQLLPSHVQSLIAEARAMDMAYDRSGLARTKAEPSDDWRAEASIPGSSNDLGRDGVDGRTPTSDELRTLIREELRRMIDAAREAVE